MKFGLSEKLVIFIFYKKKLKRFFRSPGVAPSQTKFKSKILKLQLKKKKQNPPPPPTKKTPYFPFLL